MLWKGSQTTRTYRSFGSVLSVICTEHFALHGSPSATISESTRRVGMFRSAVSGGGPVALGLIATATRLGSAFYVVPIRAWDGQDDNRAGNALPFSRTIDVSSNPRRGCVRVEGAIRDTGEHARDPKQVLLAARINTCSSPLAQPTASPATAAS
jgi:hypothetical protein